MRSLLMRSWLRPPEESGWMTEVMLAETGKKLNTVRSALTMIRWLAECMLLLLIWLSLALNNTIPKGYHRHTPKPLQPWRHMVSDGFRIALSVSEEENIAQLFPARHFLKVPPKRNPGCLPQCTIFAPSELSNGLILPRQLKINNLW